jgi:hypothetical protein
MDPSRKRRRGEYQWKVVIGATSTVDRRDDDFGGNNPQCSSRSGLGLPRDVCGSRADLCWSHRHLRDGNDTRKTPLEPPSTTLFS